MSKNNQEKKAGFNDIFSLWNGRGKVAYSTYVKEDITIPKGAKILAFRVPDATIENRKPTLKLVWVLEDN